MIKVGLDAVTYTTNQEQPEVTLDTMMAAIARCEAVGTPPPAEKEITYAEYLALLCDPRVVRVSRVNPVDGSFSIYGIRLKIVG